MFLSLQHIQYQVRIKLMYLWQLEIKFQNRFRYLVRKWLGLELCRLF